MKLAAFLVGISIFSSLGMPKGVEPVDQFIIERYLGTWYEVARLDHSFERGMSHVTATYSMRKDGGVKVVNSGYLTAKQKTKSATGKAYFVNRPDQAHLKVSFFGPFYGSYVVYELGDHYDYAFVSGPDTSYLWLLSRTPTISPQLAEHFKTSAAKLGFDTDKLIWVDQSKPNSP